MRTTSLALVSIAVLTLIAQVAAAKPPTLAPIQGVVLLRNGEVLSGTIARTGDYYQVSKPGSEIRLKANEVEKVASSLVELYEEKRLRLDPDKLQERLDLAEWCIQQKLIEQASGELTAISAIEPNHPRIVLLKRRIELASEPHTETASPAAAVDGGPANEELDRLVRGLPVHAIESFTTTIQPLLVNNCTTSGCHGPRSPGKLRLLRLSLAGPANRRLTQRNLHSVWQVIDVNQPAASPLLTQPIRPHGKAKGPIFSGNEATQYRQLVAWVYQATRQRRPAMADEEPGEPLPVASLPQPKKRSKKPPAPAVAASEASLDEPPATGEPEEDEPAHLPAEDASEAAAARALQPATNDDEYVPVDPFDAEVFNRRYLPRR
ncbi:MAG TPA: hypothetical protein VFI31_16420 [Pirellulales bacterium]|nr:hypothetical protein [Pirellulales bacterium]